MISVHRATNVLSTECKITSDPEYLLPDERKAKLCITITLSMDNTGHVHKNIWENILLHYTSAAFAVQRK